LNVDEFEGKLEWLGMKPIS